MFKNLKIGARLALSFGFVLILLATISTLSFLRVGQIGNDIDNLVNDKFPKTVWANNVIDQVNIIARALRNSLLVTKPEEAAKEIARVSAAHKMIDDNIGKLEKTVRSASGVAQINGAMGQLNQTTQQNASASEELAATAEEMSSQTEQQQNVMTFFKLDAGKPV